MDNWFQSKWFVRIVSLAFAVMLYIFVTIEVTPKQDDSLVFPGGQKVVEVMENIPVDIRINGDKYVVSGVPESVSVSLEGSQSALMPVVRQKNFTVFVDLNDLEEGTHIVEIEHENVPKELAAYIDPKEIEISIEERATADFRIDAELINVDQLPAGYEVGIPVLNLDEVTIVSSRAIIDQISLVKVYIDVANAKESIKNREVPINVYDSQGNEVKVNVKPDSVIASVNIERNSKEVTLKVPTEGKLEEGLVLKSVTPEVEKVEVFGKKAELPSITELTTTPINLDTLKDSDIVTVDVIVPENMATSQKTIKVDVQLEREKKIKDVSIGFENDAKVKFINPPSGKTNVLVRGTHDIISELKDSDLEVMIDILKLKRGEHTVKLNGKGPEDVRMELAINEVEIEIE